MKIFVDWILDLTMFAISVAPIVVFFTRAHELILLIIGVVYTFLTSYSMWKRLKGGTQVASSSTKVHEFP